jgi:hypothetical protein
MVFTYAILSVKNSYFRDEREWRIARIVIDGLFEARTKTRMSAGVEIPYEEMTLLDRSSGETPIVEIVAGPMTKSDPSIAEVRRLLDVNNLRQVSIRKSLVPLRI